MKIYSFEKLKVWQKSRELSLMVYQVTKLYPEDERFGLVSQMRRCAISISSNIAEGSGRHSSKDKARFTEIAFGSALELLNQAILSLDLKILLQENYAALRSAISEITAMFDALKKAQVKI
jgi:four helix bundle protein